MLRMTGKTHIVGGFAAATATLYLASTLGMQPGEQIPLISCGSYILSSSIAALFPDVDERKSMIGRRLIIVPLLFAIVQIFFKILIFFSFGKWKEKLKRKTRAIMHRGIAHYLITWEILTLIAVLGGVTVYVLGYGSITLYMALTGASLGYLSHLVLDILSGRIKLLAPYSDKWIGCNMFPCRSIREKLIARPALLFAGGYCLYKLLLEAL